MQDLNNTLRMSQASLDKLREADALLAEREVLLLDRLAVIQAKRQSLQVVLNIFDGEEGSGAPTTTETLKASAASKVQSSVESSAESSPTSETDSPVAPNPPTSPRKSRKTGQKAKTPRKTTGSKASRKPRGEGTPEATTASTSASTSTSVSTSTSAPTSTAKVLNSSLEDVESGSERSDTRNGSPPTYTPVPATSKSLKNDSLPKWHPYLRQEFQPQESLADIVAGVMVQEPDRAFEIADMMQTIFVEEMPTEANNLARGRVSNILSAGARSKQWYRPKPGLYSMSSSKLKS